MGKDVTPIMVYLAGPVDGLGFAEADSWRHRVSQDFPAVAFFMPNRAYANVTRHNARLVDYMNRHAIRSSHAVLANLDGPGVGFGTVREIEFARSYDEFVVVVDSKGKYVDSLMTYDLVVVSDVDEGMQKILETHAERVNAPQDLFGFPLVQLQPPEEGEDTGD